MNLTKRVITYVLIIGVFWASVCSTAEAQTKFLTWLRERVGERETKDPEQAKLNFVWQQEHFADEDAQKRFVTALKKSRCYTCHARGEKKEVRNEFGERLSARLHTHLDMDAKEITAALKSSAPEEIRREVETTFYRSIDEALEEQINTEVKASETIGAQWKRGELTIIGKAATNPDGSCDDGK